MSVLSILLRLYPGEWRARYEQEFIALLEQNHLSLIDMGDVMLGALDAHLRPQVAAAQVKNERRPFVNRTSFIKWSGMAGMVGSVLALLGLIGSSVFSDSEYPYTYDGLDIAAGLCYLTGITLLLVFAVGFGVNHGRRIGGLGQTGLLVALLGLISQFISGLIHVNTTIKGIENDSGWSFFVLGMAGMLVGFALCCLGGSIQKALPSLGSKLAMIGGFSTLAILLLSTGLILPIDSDALRPWLLITTTVVLVAFHAGLFLLGYALWNRQETVAVQIESAAMG